ncbi:MAG: MoaA/NifB/PqqE/SkfB family radical SAM enzyme [Hyphomicrobiaceae bacterium]|jgi:MoaA/NifB/PqqE/SkfB family radical SAM enzyme
MPYAPPVGNLSTLLDGIFRLHGALPRALVPTGHALPPVHLFIEVTYACNLRCNFCQYLDIIEGTAEHVGPAGKDLTMQEIMALVDQMPAGTLISFSGGEALMRKDFGIILEHASRRHRTHVISNGALINDQIAEQWNRLAPQNTWNNGYVLSCVSLEGDEATHDQIVGRPGSWKRSTDGVRRVTGIRAKLGKTFPKVNLKLVVTKDNFEGLVDFVDLAASLGANIVNFMAEHDLVSHSGTLKESDPGDRIDIPQTPPEGVDRERMRANLIAAHVRAEEAGLEIRLTPVVPIDEFVRHYGSIEERRLDASEYECGSAWSRMAAGADGRWSPTCFYLREGDTRTQSLSDAWNSEASRNLRKRIRAHKVFAGCNGCCNLRYKGPLAMGLAGTES